MLSDGGSNCAPNGSHRCQHCQHTIHEKKVREPFSLVTTPHVCCTGHSELIHGLKVVDEDNNKLTKSKVSEYKHGKCVFFTIQSCLQVAARYGVGQTLLSRILLASVVMGRSLTLSCYTLCDMHCTMCVPGLPAGIMYTFEKTALFKVSATILSQYLVYCWVMM